MTARCRLPRQTRRPLVEMLEDRCVPATLTHVYDFSTNLNDRLGGPALAADGGTVQNGRYDFGADQGLRLAGALADSNSYTVVIDMRMDSIPNRYLKLLDFQQRSDDSGLYIV